MFGLVHGQANPKIEMVQNENPALELIEGDLRDLSSLIAVVEQVQPDEVYNLGAISFVQLSFKQAELTAEITGLGVLRMLEAVRIVGGTDNNPIRFYQASSSEMFGKVHETPQTENTPFHPRSPYGVAKVFGHYTTMNYREAYGIHASSGILFNHEGPKRGLEFVTRKVTNAVARIKLGLQDSITLGNLDASRDWGYAGDYVEAMWMMLQQDDARRLRDRDRRDAHDPRAARRRRSSSPASTTGQPYVKQDPRFYRPAEVDLLIGDASKARKALGWKPRVELRRARAHDVRERPRRGKRQSATRLVPRSAARRSWRRARGRARLRRRSGARGRPPGRARASRRRPAPPGSTPCSGSTSEFSSPPRCSALASNALRHLLGELARAPRGAPRCTASTRCAPRAASCR